MDLYFQGMAWFNKGRNPADIARARDFFERALALDPHNLDAVVGTAAADVQAATGYYVDDKAKRLVSVEANLNRVLSRSPNNALAHYLMGGAAIPKTSAEPKALPEGESALASDPEFGFGARVDWSRKGIDGHPGRKLRASEREALRVSPHDTEADVWVACIALAKLYLGDTKRGAQLLSPRPRSGTQAVPPDVSVWLLL